MLERIRSCCSEETGRNAFFIQGCFYTYAQFAERISAIRTWIEAEAGAEDNIGILTYDDLDTYASVFAVWFAGKAMVPIGASHPPARNANILRQVGVRSILASRDGDSGLRQHVDALFVVTAELRPPPIRTMAPAMTRSEDDVAYILFTSGSTGVPKGVPITYRALNAFLRAFAALGLELDSRDRVLQMFDLTFDLSLMSYIVPLTVGACVYTVAPDGIKYLEIYRLLEEQQLTCALMVPSILAHLRAFFGEIRVERMRVSMFCGEALYDDLVTEWSACVPNARLLNVYGPTEATIFCMAYECARGVPHKAMNGIVSIGRRMQEVGTIIVDDQNRPVTIGQKGELCLGGPQLTPGYWQNPARNKDAFFVLEGVRYYRTGDLCVEDEEGDIQYCGRTDQQVKVQGYRVELSEIEHHVRELTGLKHVAAVACADVAGNTLIHLYVERFEGTIANLLIALQMRMPPYMMPWKTTSLEALPLNTNGKIDRPALRQLANSANAANDGRP